MPIALTRRTKLLACAFSAVVAIVVVCRRRSAPVERVSPAAAPTGEVRVRLRDSDSDVPLIARVVARPLVGRYEPAVIDVRHEGVLRLDVGRYRISATKGMEWSMDAEEVDVTPERPASVTLRLWHVVNPETLVACDLNVHSVSMGDSSMSEDERVVAAAASGIQFLLASGPDIGKYGPALSRTGLESRVYVAGRRPTVEPLDLFNGRTLNDLVKTRTPTSGAGGRDLRADRWTSTERWRRFETGIAS